MSALKKTTADRLKPKIYAGGPAPVPKMSATVLEYEKYVPVQTTPIRPGAMDAFALPSLSFGKREVRS